MVLRTLKSPTKNSKDNISYNDKKKFVEQKREKREI